MAGVAVVLDPGPIPYQALPIYGDADLEHGLRQAGLEPMETSYRLIEIPLDEIGDVRSMPRWKHMGRGYVDLVREGVEFPPIVVMPARTGWTLIDGVNRTYAYWLLRWESVRAYDLIDASRVFL